MMKFGISIGFPGTPMFTNYLRKGLIKSFDWDDYHIYTERPLFAHETLNYDTILKYIHQAYRRAVLFNPSYIARRALRGARTGEFFWDLYYFLRFVTMPSTNKAVRARYFAEDRWPVVDFHQAPPKPSTYQKVSRQQKDAASQRPTPELALIS